jgi:hypothetical protein
MYVVDRKVKSWSLLRLDFSLVLEGELRLIYMLFEFINLEIRKNRKSSFWLTSGLADLIQKLQQLRQ